MSRKAIAKAAKIMNDAGLMEITTEYSACFGLFKRKIHLSKQVFCTTGAAICSGGGAAGPGGGAENAGFLGDGAPIDIRDAITSPMVGVVYLSPDQNSKPFADIGGKVAAGDTLCLIEAMKTFNPVKAPKDGVVAEILVKDGETVEYGTPLIIIH